MVSSPFCLWEQESQEQSMPPSGILLLLTAWRVAVCPSPCQACLLPTQAHWQPQGRGKEVGRQPLQRPPGSAVCGGCQAAKARRDEQVGTGILSSLFTEPGEASIHLTFPWLERKEEVKSHPTGLAWLKTAAIIPVLATAGK